MVKTQEGASLEGASVSDLRFERPSANDLGLIILEPRGVAGRRQASRRGYKKLFFDCGLHLVLQQLLQRRSLSPSSPSASAAPSSYESKAEDGLTDAEVARLLRRHLNILVGSQEASDAEVVEAARVLEQKFRHLLKAVPEELSNERHEISAKQSMKWRSTEDRLTSQSSSGEARPSEDASQQATSCWSGGFCVNASQVVDEGQDERENNVSAESFDYRRSGSIGGLVLSQTQESQPNGAAQDVTAAEALVGDESGTNRCGESRLTTRSSHDQPAKKFRAGLQNWR